MLPTNKRTITIQELRIQLSDAGVETTVVERYVALIERLQDRKRIFGPELLAIGGELLSLEKHIRQKYDERRAEILNAPIELPKEF